MPLAVFTTVCRSIANARGRHEMRIDLSKYLNVRLALSLNIQNNMVTKKQTKPKTASTITTMKILDLSVKSRNNSNTRAINLARVMDMLNI